jgi:Holliday junction resolvase
MNYAKKVDKNQKEIVAEFRKLGFSVYITSHVGAGFPDLICGIDGKHTILVEVKSTEKAKFTDAQSEFMSKWTGGPVVRIDSIEGVQRLANMLK